MNNVRMIFNRQKEPLFVTKDAMRHVGYPDGVNVEDALSHVPLEWRSKAFVQTDNGRELLDVLTYEGLLFFGGPALVE